MPVTVAVLRESAEGERRVPAVPGLLEKYAGRGASLRVEAGAGTAAGLPDGAWDGAEVVPGEAVTEGAGLVLCVRMPGPGVIARLAPGTVLAGLLEPHRGPERLDALRDAKITAFAMELIPRISRAQSMDALSSQASVAGYAAVLIGANALPRFLPMLTTAAGTIRPARVLVIGAGVAGLQAIATARRLGAVVEAYDVRAATREQVASLGAKFVDIPVQAEGEGGYARELTGEERAEQQRILADRVGAADMVVCTAAVPGRPAPRIVSTGMAGSMRPGSVIVDLAAESGGNCEATRAGETVDVNGVAVIGPVNLPSRLAAHASEMYARNLYNFVSPFLGEDGIGIDWNDEIYEAAVVTHDGEIRHG